MVRPRARNKKHFFLGGCRKHHFMDGQEGNEIHNGFFKQYIRYFLHLPFLYRDVSQNGVLGQWDLFNVLYTSELSAVFQ